MKTLVVYASKTGTVEKCVKLICSKLSDVKAMNIYVESEDLKHFDLIIVGSSIRMGMIDKKIKKFLTKNMEYLKQKNTAYFICCGFSENWEEYYKQNIPKDLLDRAIIYDTFGGEIDIKKQKGFDKLIVKIVSKNMDSGRQIKILTNNIDKFIRKLKNLDC